MKKMIALVVPVLCVLSLAGLSFAAEKAEAPAKAEKKAPVKVNQVVGEVAAVDASAKTLTVKGRRGEVTVSADDKTVVRVGREKKTLADVKVGDRAMVRYTEADGKNMASIIGIMAKRQASEKKEAAPKAEEKKPAGKK
ncbi:MAG: hypothetical protein M1497_02885 [Nitrospirae bacterium]|nr:hypothetical protein [Nitrospirota bacterium]